MFPLRDVIPSRTAPVVTVALVAANVAAFLIQQWLSPASLVALVGQWGLVPAHYSPASVFTAMFLHEGWLHAGANALALWIFGENVEDRLGRGRFLLFYLGCGVAAALAYTWRHPASPVPLVGASGAVAGVMGAYLVLYPGSRVLVAVWLLVRRELLEVAAVVFAGGWLLLHVASGLGVAALPVVAAGGLAFWAQAGGFAAGAAAIKLLVRRERSGPDWYDPR
ncbi:MAG TPA: rhomboid family intramembrane serine protease [Methylomirabilota bacterium]